MKFKGAQPIVQVLNPREKQLEEKARDVLIGRTVTGVFLIQDQLRIQLDDGGVFTMACDGGFKEVG